MERIALVFRSVSETWNVIPTVIASNLLSNRKTKTRSAILPVGYKRVKHVVPNGFGDTGSVIGHSNLHMVIHSHRMHFDFPCGDRDRLTGVQQQVVKGTVEFLEIKPALSGSFMREPDIDVSEFRAKLDGLDGPFQRIEQVAVCKLE